MMMTVYSRLMHGTTQEFTAIFSQPSLSGVGKSKRAPADVMASTTENCAKHDHAKGDEVVSVTTNEVTFSTQKVDRTKTVCV